MWFINIIHLNNTCKPHHLHYHIVEPLFYRELLNSFSRKSYHSFVHCCVPKGWAYWTPYASISAITYLPFLVLHLLTPPPALSSCRAPLLPWTAQFIQQKTLSRQRPLMCPQRVIISDPICIHFLCYTCKPHHLNYHLLPWTAQFIQQKTLSRLRPLMCPIMS